MANEKPKQNVQAKVKDVIPKWEANKFYKEGSTERPWKLKRIIHLEPHSKSAALGDTLTCFGRENTVEIGRNAAYIFTVTTEQGRDVLFVNVDSAVMLEGSAPPMMPEIPPMPTEPQKPTNGNTPVPGTDNAARVRGMAMHRAVESWVALVCHDKASIARTKLGMNLNGSEKDLILALADIAEKEKFPGDKS